MTSDSDWGSIQQFVSGFVFAEHFSITVVPAVGQDDKVKTGDWPIFVLMDHREIIFQGKRTMTGYRVCEYLPRSGSG